MARAWRARIGPTAAAPGGLDALPRVAWEGANTYWDGFSVPAAAGWNSPSFYPIGLWYGGISSDDEAAWDKAHGVNFYTGGMWDQTPYSLFADNDVFWVGSEINASFTPASTNWVGRFLDDEVDGRYTPAAGFAYLQGLLDEFPDDGRFVWTNYTQMVISNDMAASDGETFVNRFTDAVSLDMYYYGIPFCDLQPYRGDIYITPIVESNCRMASSYGKTMKSLRMRDTADGRLQSLWQFVELFNGGPGVEYVRYITPGELKGAVMSSIINEARGILYFNQSLGGPYQSGNVIRSAQLDPAGLAAPNVQAAGEVNGQIHALAPIINSQSYEWVFGAGLDTMLKADSTHAYLFAMIDGASSPGTRTFTLPAGVTGRAVSVVDENRTLTADGAGVFTDSFAAEYAYHIYKIPL